jgi:hypothetical protein
MGCLRPKGLDLTRTVRGMLCVRLNALREGIVELRCDARHLRMQGMLRTREIASRNLTFEAGKNITEGSSSAKDVRPELALFWEHGERKIGIHGTVQRPVRFLEVCGPTAAVDRRSSFVRLPSFQLLSKQCLNVTNLRARARQVLDARRCVVRDVARRAVDGSRMPVNESGRRDEAEDNCRENGGYHPMSRRPVVSSRLLVHGRVNLPSEPVDRPSRISRRPKMTHTTAPRNSKVEARPPQSTLCFSPASAANTKPP